MREERYRRALRRRRTEEIMGWICVPLIIFVGWYAFKAWEERNLVRPSASEPAQPAAATILRR